MINTLFKGINNLPLQGHRRKIFELEAKQRVLECTFRNIKQLRSELSYINKEAESRQEQIHGFLSAFIPEFKSYAGARFQDSRRNFSSLNSEEGSKPNIKSINGNSTDGNIDDTPHNNQRAKQKSLKESKQEIEKTFEDYKSEKRKTNILNNVPVATEVVSSVDQSKLENNTPFLKGLRLDHKSSDGKPLPLPKVEYDWTEKEHKIHKMPTYLPRLGKQVMTNSGHFEVNSGITFI